MSVLNERTTFPPHDMTEAEEAAIAGRFVMSPEARPDPAGSGIGGREKVPPHGVVYVRAPVLAAREQAAEEEIDEGVDEGITVVEQADVVEQAEVVEQAGTVESVGDEGDDLESWTVQELKDALDQVEVPYDSKAHKADLIALLREAEAE
jgi:hypothetical protein